VVNTGNQNGSEKIQLNGVRVCVIVNQIYYTDARVMSYANVLAQAGAEVDVIASKHSDRTDPERHQNIKVYSSPIARNYRDGLGYMINYILSTTFLVFYTLLLYFKRRYQIIHVNNMPDTLILAALIPRIMGAKVVFDIHDPMPNVFMSKYGMGPDHAVVRFFTMQEKMSARLSDEVITANPMFKDLLVERGTPVEKILVINNIPNPKLFNRQNIKAESHPPSDKFTLIFPGTIAPRYGLDIAIKALPKLVMSIPNIQLKIIGKNSQNSQHAEELAALGAELNVTENINFVPAIPTDQIASEIAKADVGIYTALPDPHMSIAMPGKVLEFATIGIPVVASRVPILEAFFNDEAILFFTPGNTDEFCDHILKLYHSPTLRKSLIENANKMFTDKYSWKKEFDQYLALIHKLAFS
jgi:glycosyltransferase involved in cell wall biosynthesis